MERWVWAHLVLEAVEVSWGTNRVCTLLNSSWVEVLVLEWKVEQVDVKSLESFVVWLVGSQWGWVVLLAEMDVDDFEELGVEMEM